jgi:hypothetical protein
MSVYSGPEIASDGLVFAYDMANTQKSFKGAPATNLVPNADTMASWGPYGAGNDGTFITEFGTTGYQMINRASWNGIVRGITLPSTGIYTFSAWVKYAGGSASNNGGAVYISGWGGGDSATTTNKLLAGQWQRVTITLNCTTTSMTFFLISYGGTNDGVSDKSTWYVTMPQVEAGSFATPFVNGTRSNTQALLDLTNNTTITANSLTYASDNTFSFNGSNYVSTTNVTSTNVLTVNMVVRVTSDPGSYKGFIGANNGTGNDYQIGFNIDLGAASGTSVDYIAIEGAGITAGNFLTSTIPFNQWFNLCAVISTTACTVYINGVQNNSIARPAATIMATNFLTIGARPVTGTGSATSYAFNGSIALTQLYNRVLTAAEIQQNFSAVRGRFGI